MPDKYYSVVDKASLLKADEFKLLSEKLDAFKRQTKNELVVVIIPSLGSTPIEVYANDLFNTWGIGQKDKNNGILLLIAINDHKMRIETGYGIEDKITDTESAYILDNILKPNFKSGNFYQGLVLASDFLISELSSDLSHKNYFDATNSNSSTYDINELISVNRKDSFEPWIVSLISFLLQLIVGLSILIYLKFKKLDELYEKLIISMILINILYILFLSFFAIISNESKLLYSSMNITYIGSSLFLIIYFAGYLLPKKVKKLLDILVFQIIKLFICALLSFIISTFTLLFSDTFFVYLTVFLILTIVLFVLSFKFNLGNTASEFFKSGSGSYYSNNNSSSYNSTSYNSSSSGSSGSSYGGGSSGGGGASGSW
jgi:uncharacterized membrane protein YgcG